MDWKERIGLAKTTKQKMYVPKWTVKKFWPTVRFTDVWKPGMDTHVIRADSIEEFLKRHRVLVCYFPHDANKRNGDLGLFDATEVVIKGIVTPAE